MSLPMTYRGGQHHVLAATYLHECTLPSTYKNQQAPTHQYMLSASCHFKSSNTVKPR